MAPRQQVDSDHSSHKGEYSWPGKRSIERHIGSQIHHVLVVGTRQHRTSLRTPQGPRLSTIDRVGREQHGSYRNR